MSPEVREELRRRHPCTCGAKPGQPCRGYISGRPLGHVHSDRVFRDLFQPDPRT